MYQIIKVPFNNYKIKINNKKDIELKNIQKEELRHKPI